MTTIVAATTTTTATVTKVLLIEFVWYVCVVLRGHTVQRRASVPGEEHENIDGDTEQENHSIPHEPVEANKRRKPQITSAKQRYQHSSQNSGRSRRNSVECSEQTENKSMVGFNN